MYNFVHSIFPFLYILIVSLTDTSGVVREMIAVIENRKKHPQINTLIKILEPFGYTLSITKIDKNK